MKKHQISPKFLSIEKVTKIIERKQKIELSQEAFDAVKKCREYLDKKAIESLQMARIRLDFTFESENKTREILALFQSKYLNGDSGEISLDYTRGHFRRGVL